MVPRKLTYKQKNLNFQKAIFEKEVWSKITRKKRIPRYVAVEPISAFETKPNVCNCCALVLRRGIILVKVRCSETLREDEPQVDFISSNPS